MVAMAACLVGKVEQDQRVTGMVGRTGENRTRRLYLTELNLAGDRLAQGERKKSKWFTGYAIERVFP